MFASAPSVADNASLIRELADAIKTKKNDPLPDWKLAQVKGDPLQWHEWYSHFKSAINLLSLTDYFKLTTLKYSSPVKQMLQLPGLLTVVSCTRMNQGLSHVNLASHRHS